MFPKNRRKLDSNPDLDRARNDAAVSTSSPNARIEAAVPEVSVIFEDFSKSWLETVVLGGPVITGDSKSAESMVTAMIIGIEGAKTIN